MAPNAPMGAVFMIRRTRPSSARDSVSMNSNSGAPRAPTALRASPNTTENSSTCRMSDRASASTMLVGMMPSRKSVAVRDRAEVTYCATADGSSFAASTFMPTPGSRTFTATSPMSSAIVLTISK